MLAPPFWTTAPRGFVQRGKRHFNRLCFSEVLVTLQLSGNGKECFGMAFVMLGIDSSGNRSPMTPCETGGEGGLRLALGRLLAAGLPKMCPGSPSSPEKCQKASWDRLFLQQWVAPVPAGDSVSSLLCQWCSTEMFCANPCPLLSGEWVSMQVAAPCHQQMTQFWN